MRWAAFLLTGALAALSPAGVSAAVTTSYDAARSTLHVESDAADEIVVACMSNQTIVNGLPPASGPVGCSDVVTLLVNGGPGSNRIDLSGAALGSFSSKGISSSASVSAGAGDDHIVGPAGAVVTRLEGGSGSDRIEGRAYDTYVFGQAFGAEADTIVEPGSAACDPAFAETDQPNLSYWTVPWDALDFSTLEQDDGVQVRLGAPGGIVAEHKGRAVRLESRGAQPLDAIAGGEGDDLIAGACMADGGMGDDRLSGSPTGDLLVGGGGNDLLTGGDGRDSLDGGAGKDVLLGGPGADKIIGAPGDDELAGGSGGDVYLFGSADGPQVDTVSELPAAGVDVLSLDYGRAGVRIDLGTPDLTFATAPGTRILSGLGRSGGLEGAIGGIGDDVLLGNGAGNHFWGGGGTDLAVGRSGNDVYHVDWAASLPAAAYGSFEAWVGPIPRGAHHGRSIFASRPPARLRIVEGSRGGRDTVDLAEGRLSSPGLAQRLEGQIFGGASVDLSGRGPIVRAGRVSAVSGSPGTAANLEDVRGTIYDDNVVGNAAANRLEGRHGRDWVNGLAGEDTCLVYRSDDVLRGCEHIRASHPDR